jgi:hypothetical protein
MRLASIDKNAQQLHLLFYIVSFYRENFATKKGQRKGWPSLGRKCVSFSLEAVSVM